MAGIRSEGAGRGAPARGAFGLAADDSTALVERLRVSTEALINGVGRRPPARLLAKLPLHVPALPQAKDWIGPPRRARRMNAPTAPPTHPLAVAPRSPPGRSRHREQRVLPDVVTAFFLFFRDALLGGDVARGDALWGAMLSLGVLVALAPR